MIDDDDICTGIDDHLFDLIDFAGTDQGCWIPGLQSLNDRANDFSAGG
jgi:hypothetical protein